jgi:hypothetical protein
MQQVCSTSHTTYPSSQRLPVPALLVEWQDEHGGWLASLLGLVALHAAA